MSPKQIMQVDERQVRFSFRKRTALPRLAWCMQYDLHSGTIFVDHGPWVETREKFFCEGAWSGPFQDGRFDASYSFTGSGAMLRDGKLVVVTPCHTIEGVYSIVGKNGMVFFANSIAFLLCSAGEELDLSYLGYEADILSICDGIHVYKKEIPAASGNRIRLHYYCNIVVDRDGVMQEQPKPVPDPFRSYEEYRAFLRSEIKGGCDNAQCLERNKRYRPVVFCSNGYDSPACAALAHEAGCDEVVVFETKKKSIRSDSGLEIVRILGYDNINQLDELDYKRYDCADLFVASGELGTSIFFAAAASQLVGGILFSGVNGDRVWDKSCSIVADGIVRFFFPDSARNEFRLVTGYLNFPVPFLSVMRGMDLYTISNSREMAPWCVGGDYDRPIPRRILEEKGVPRGLFGYEKGGGCGTSLRFGTLRRLKVVMPPASYPRFLEYYRSVKKKRKITLAWIRQAVRYWLYLAATVLTRGKFTNPLERPPFSWIHRILGGGRPYRADTCSPFAPSFLFHWGVHCMQEKYYAVENDRASEESQQDHPSAMVSVIIPCRNEAGWIARCLDSIADNDYPKDRLEVLIVDGMSDDGTREIVEDYTARYPYMRLLDNPKKITPSALNVGIETAKGDIIMRMDAHYEYQPNYIKKLIAWLEESGADNVGGLVVMKPANDTAIARAIAVAVCHPFGVGNAYYRIGTSKPRWVDTVPFGCYRKEVFDRIGRFDEELVRNQDIEFNLRLRKLGGTILLVPDIVIHGQARGSLSKLWRMYYQYGYFNPLVVWNLGGKMSLRQIITPAFVGSIFVSLILAAWFPWMLLVCGAILAAYFSTMISCSISSVRKHGVACALRLPLVFSILHISHGLGFIRGLFHLLTLGRRFRPRAMKTTLSR